MADDPKPLEPGKIRFHQASPPPLRPGDYTLKVTQALSGARTTAANKKNAPAPFDEQYGTEAPFAIAGPRFYLKPSEVYSVYPPSGQFGPFDNALPHIVFTRRTLPWERTIDGKPPNNTTPVPWMALLLFARSDFTDGELPKVEARTVGELREPEDATIQGPQGLKLEHGQSDSDLCNTIDLPAALYAEVAPTFEDLPFLAHVRDVNTGGKETLSLIQDGWFTVVLGNRLPATSTTDEGETNLVCLVSLEGFSALLPKVSAGRATVTLESGKTDVRLAVLASWRFTCHGKNDFKTKMQELDDKSLLSLPGGELTATDDGTAAVKNAFTLGYTGINHTTRLGEKTVSWYRGPLVPLEMAPRSPYAAIPAADRALRYDLDSGLFAAEYAAAFELGRMMALQNRSFASAMYRHRNRVARDLAAEQHRAGLEGALGVPASYRGKFADKHEASGYRPFVGAGSLEAAASRLFAGWALQSDQPPVSQPINAATAVSFDPPPEVTRFLARAVLLYGVPFTYLVPDERMLPPESIRFFFLDPGWIATLIQGATSVGHLDARDTVLDTYLRFNALGQALVDAALVRGADAGPASTEPKAAKANWPLTGFLLRSELVDGWQGVEMRAYDKDGKELPPLRIDRLAPDILLCIFNGKVMKLTVKQPPEGLHFGLSPQSGGRYKRLSLRKVTAASSGVEPGAQIPDSHKNPIQAPMREPVEEGGRPTRVVRMAEMAIKLADGLKALGHSASTNFTSAELAVEMVESPGLADFEGAKSS